MKPLAQVIGAIAFCAMGMVGLSNGIEYSGWVLFIGLLWAVVA